MRGQTKRDPLKKCLAIRIEHLINCCVHSGRDVRSRNGSAEFLHVAFRLFWS